MAQEMNESQRKAALEAFNPAEHLIDIRDKQGNIKKYLPAAWRLYELSLRYPNANFSSDIVCMNEDADFVIMRARLYLGTDYAASEKRAEAHKQGRLSLLDKIETAAKARAARDFGIGTEYALDMSEDDETDAVHATQQKKQKPAAATIQPASITLQQVKAVVRKAGKASNPATWQAYVTSILGTFVEEPDQAQLKKLLDGARSKDTQLSA